MYFKRKGFFLKLRTVFILLVVNVLSHLTLLMSQGFRRLCKRLLFHTSLGIRTLNTLEAKDRTRFECKTKWLQSRKSYRSSFRSEEQLSTWQVIKGLAQTGSNTDGQAMAIDYARGRDPATSCLWRGGSGETAEVVCKVQGIHQGHRKFRSSMEVCLEANTTITLTRQSLTLTQSEEVW